MTLKLTDTQVQNWLNWANGLISGKYEQGRHKLYSYEYNNYCCLGVEAVCRGRSLSVIAEIAIRVEDEQIVKEAYGVYLWRPRSFSSETEIIYWNTFLKRLEIHPEAHDKSSLQALWEANDDGKFTFNELGEAIYRFLVYSVERNENETH